MSEERRVADDGKIYTKAQFEEWYGMNAEKYFSKAIPVPNSCDFNAKYVSDGNPDSSSSSTPSEQVLHEKADEDTRVSKDHAELFSCGEWYRALKSNPGSQRRLIICMPFG